VADRPLTLGELTELLDRFPLERAGDRTFDEVTDAQVQHQLARIAALTEMLRGATPNETAQLASRMLLRDLTAVAAHFRARANTIRPTLVEPLARLRESLARCDAPSDE
jgi:hypothetical protein